MKLHLVSKGDVILEALIGIFLLGVLGAGMLYASGRIVYTQRDNNLQSRILAHSHQQMTDPDKGMYKLCEGSTQISSMPGPQVMWSLENCVQGSPNTVQVSAPGVLEDKIDTVVYPTAKLKATESSRTSQDGRGED